jgi:hypothetical protein
VSPVVLLVEDAQYADSGLLEFLDHLTDWAKNLSVYVLVFAHPELGHGRPGFGTGRNRSTLTLDPLDPVSMDQLVDALVPGMPPAARSAVTSQAQGIPLFAVETVRALIDRDIVRPVEGVYQLTGDVGQLAVKPPPPPRISPKPFSTRAARTITTSTAVRPGRPPAPRPRSARPCAYGAVWPRPTNSSPPPCRSCAQILMPIRCTRWANWRRLASTLTFAITNLVQALLMVGDWDGADRELSQAVDSDGLAVIEHIACYRGWLAALRGDVASAEAMLAGLRDLRGNEDVQTRAEISLAEAFIAAAHRQPDEALRHARDVVALRDALGISHECVRWGWPLAARAAHELSDVAATGELLTLLDSYQPGYLAPVLHAERGLSRARLADREDGQSADAAFAAAIASLRQQSTPYHLAHGLLDYAEHLLGRGDAERAATAIEEARGIGTGLRCEPLLTRADAIEHVKPRIPA